MTAILSDMAKADPRVAAVVIGRNEGQRLVKCLESVRSHIGSVVYVDSGSVDGSVERAASMGVRTVTLTTGPYTAARGRQAGLDELERAGSGEPIEYVLFIDGDCILDPGFVSAAIDVLDREPKVAGVCARRREMHTKTSFYSRMIDLDWDIPPGEVPYVGGDWLARWKAIREVGGWSIDLIAGEEPDLSFRMRDKGWKIIRLAREMTLHDIAMKSFRPYWRRAVRSGYAYAEVGWKHRHGLGREWVRPTIGIMLYGVAVPVAIVTMAWLPWPWWIGAVLAGLLWLKCAASMLRYCLRKGVAFGTAFWYTAMNMICKVAAAIGVSKYILRSALGQRQELIEYKGAEGGVSSTAAVQHSADGADGVMTEGSRA